MQLNQYPTKIPSFPRKREPRAASVRAAAPCSGQGQALGPRFFHCIISQWVLQLAISARTPIKIITVWYGRCRRGQSSPRRAISLHVCGEARREGAARLQAGDELADQRRAAEDPRG